MPNGKKKGELESSNPQMVTRIKEPLKQTANSFDVANSNIDKILNTICQKQWEKEVIQKKSKPHSIGWVFNQAQECHFFQPDPNRVTTQFDEDGEVEPDAGRSDWYQTDKTKSKIIQKKVPIITVQQKRPSSKSSDKQLLRRPTILLAKSLTKKIGLNFKQNSLSRMGTIPDDDNDQNESNQKRPIMREASQQVVISRLNESLELLNGTLNLSIQNLAQPRISLTRQKSQFYKDNEEIENGPLKQNLVEKNNLLSTDTIQVRGNNGDSEAGSETVRQKATYNKAQTISLFSNDKTSLKDSFSDAGSIKSIPKSKKSATKKNRFTIDKKKGNEMPKQIPIPKSAAELQEIAQDQAFYEQTKEFRTQLGVKQMMKQRKDQMLTTKRVANDHEQFYKIESSLEMAIKKVNVDNLTPIPLNAAQITIQKGLHRIPMKTKQILHSVLGTSSNSVEMISQTSQLATSQAQAQVQMSRNLPSPDQITITNSTRLLDVLAEEFEQHGRTVDLDIRGYKEINGLKMNQTKVRDISGRQSQQQTSEKNEDDYRGSLSSIKNIKVQPGVILKEFASFTKQNEAIEQDSEFVKVSGGDFKIANNLAGGQSKQMMSTKQYSQMSGVRIYERQDKQKLKQKSPRQQENDAQASAANQSLHLKVVDMRGSEELAEVAYQASQRKPYRLFPKGSQLFGQDKNKKGKVIFNWPPSVQCSLPQGRKLRSSLEQRNYIQGLMVEKLDQQDIDEYHSNRKAATVISDRTNNVNQSIMSSDRNQSQNPMKHEYARVFDLQLNAKLKMRKKSYADHQEMEFDSINQSNATKKVADELKKNSNQQTNTAGLNKIYSSIGRSMKTTAFESTQRSKGLFTIPKTKEFSTFSNTSRARLHTPGLNARPNIGIESQAHCGAAKQSRQVEQEFGQGRGSKSANRYVQSALSRTRETAKVLLPSPST